MVSKKVQIINATGLHLRPAGVLCDTAIRFKSEVKIKKGTVESNAKSLLGVLGARIKSGDEIEIICRGEDEEQALAAVAAAIESGLGDG